MSQKLWGTILEGSPKTVGACWILKVPLRLCWGVLCICRMLWRCSRLGEYLRDSENIPGSVKDPRILGALMLMSVRMFMAVGDSNGTLEVSA